MAYDKSARIALHFDAAPEQVWTALTDASALTAWYWPAAYPAERFRPGSR
jgi:uncharacterized protein YndB with AHSA1/START domain